MAVDASLGTPLPPLSPIYCPTPFFKPFDPPATETDSLIAHYHVAPATDLSAKENYDGDGENVSCGEYPLRATHSQTFMASLLNALRLCLGYEKFRTQTYRLGVEVVNPFLQKVGMLHGVGNVMGSSRGVSCVRVESCLCPESSIQLTLTRVQSEFESICGSYVQR